MATLILHKLNNKTDLVEPKLSIIPISASDSITSKFIVVCVK